MAEFVAELMPQPDGRIFESPLLMRELGLICENVDGFDRPCVFRSIPHTLGLSFTIEPQLRAELPVVVHHTGWSGDGSPIDGSLRDFAVGAVIQHFPKTLDRVVGTDFDAAQSDAGRDRRAPGSRTGDHLHPLGE